MNPLIQGLDGGRMPSSKPTDIKIMFLDDSKTAQRGTNGPVCREIHRRHERRVARKESADTLIIDFRLSLVLEGRLVHFIMMPHVGATTVRDLTRYNVFQSPDKPPR